MLRPPGTPYNELAEERKNISYSTRTSRYFYSDYNDSKTGYTAKPIPGKRDFSWKIEGEFPCAVCCTDIEDILLFEDGTSVTVTGVDVNDQLISTKNPAPPTYESYNNIAILKDSRFHYIGYRTMCDYRDNYDTGNDFIMIKKSSKIIQLMRFDTGIAIMLFGLRNKKYGEFEQNLFICRYQTVEDDYTMQVYSMKIQGETDIGSPTLIYEKKDIIVRNGIVENECFYLTVVEVTDKTTSPHEETAKIICSRDGVSWSEISDQRIPVMEDQMLACKRGTLCAFQSGSIIRTYQID